MYTRKTDACKASVCRGDDYGKLSEGRSPSDAYSKTDDMCVSFGRLAQQADFTPFAARRAEGE